MNFVLKTRYCALKNEIALAKSAAAAATSKPKSAFVGVFSNMKMKILLLKWWFYTNKMMISSVSWHTQSARSVFVKLWRFFNGNWWFFNWKMMIFACGALRYGTPGRKKWFLNKCEDSSTENEERFVEKCWFLPAPKHLGFSDDQHEGAVAFDAAAR